MLYLFQIINTSKAKYTTVKWKYFSKKKLQNISFFLSLLPF